MSTCVQVQFLVKEPCSQGEIVAVIGSSPSLGEWDHRRALRLSSGAGDNWQGSATFEQGVEFHYRYIKLHTSSGNVVQWESMPHPRSSIPRLQLIQSQITHFPVERGSSAKNGSVPQCPAAAAAALLPVPSDRAPYWDVELCIADAEPVGVASVTLQYQAPSGECSAWLLLSPSPFHPVAATLEDALFAAAHAQLLPLSATGTTSIALQTTIPARFARVYAVSHRPVRMKSIRCFSAPTAAPHADSASSPLLIQDGEVFRHAAAPAAAAWLCPDSAPQLRLSIGSVARSGCGVTLASPQPYEVHAALISAAANWPRDWAPSAAPADADADAAPGDVADAERKAGDEAAAAAGARQPAAAWGAVCAQATADGGGSCGGVQRTAYTIASGPVTTFAVDAAALRAHKANIRISVVASSADGNGSEEASVLGCAWLVPAQFTAKSKGVITCPLIHPMSGVVGSVVVSYLLIRPFCHPDNNLRSVFRSHWSTQHCVEIGHRGAGKSYHASPGQRLSPWRENTLLSYLVASRHCDYVEFDVLLSKDRVPVIYHDYFVNMELAPLKPEPRKFTQLCTPRAAAAAAAPPATPALTAALSLADGGVGSSGGGGCELVQMGIHELTLRQLRSQNVLPTESSSSALRSLLRKHWGSIQTIARHSRPASPAPSSPILHPTPSAAPSAPASASASAPSAPALALALSALQQQPSEPFAVAKRMRQRQRTTSDGSSDGGRSSSCSVSSVSTTATGSSGSSSSLSAGGGTKLVQALTQLPTLEQLFRFVPEHTAFDLEVKFPMQHRQDSLLSLPEFDMNAYLDAILALLFTHASSRRIVLTCFCPDACAALRLKQARYPVLLITAGGSHSDDIDSRGDCTPNALAFARAEQLQGVVSQAGALVAQPQLIKQARDSNLLLFSYGDDNNSVESVRLQREWGISGICTDTPGILQRPQAQPGGYPMPLSA